MGLEEDRNSQRLEVTPVKQREEHSLQDDLNSVSKQVECHGERYPVPESVSCARGTLKRSSL